MTYEVVNIVLMIKIDLFGMQITMYPDNMILSFQSTQRNNDETPTASLRLSQNSTKKTPHPQYSHNVACVASRVHRGLYNHIGLFHFWSWEQHRHSHLTNTDDAILFCNPAMHISNQ